MSIAGYFSYFTWLVKKIRGYNRKRSFPTAMQIQTQSSCNGQCAICPYVSLRNKQPQGVMSQDLFEKIVYQVSREPSFSTMSFTLQNEPLLDKRVFAWIKYFKHFNPGKRAVLCSNGELVGDYPVEEIIQSPFDCLTISLNAHTEETFNSIQKGIDYHKVIKNINLLLACPSVKPRLKFSFVLTRGNQQEIAAATRYWKERGVKTRVMYLSNRVKTAENFNKYCLVRKPVQGIKNKIKKYLIKNLFPKCQHPFCYMNILYNGDVILCCHDWRRNPVIGNVNQDSLRSIWNSARMNEVRSLIMKKRYKEIVACSQCNKVQEFLSR